MKYRRMTSSSKTLDIDTDFYQRVADRLTRNSGLAVCYRFSTENHNLQFVNTLLSTFSMEYYKAFSIDSFDIHKAA